MPTRSWNCSCWRRGPVKTFTVQLKNIPLANQVRFQIEHKTQKVFIAPADVRDITFSNDPRPARRSTRYLYHVKIKSDRSFCPYFDDVPRIDDQRWLGVQAHIQLAY